MQRWQFDIKRKVFGSALDDYEIDKKVKSFYFIFFYVNENKLK